MPHIQTDHLMSSGMPYSASPLHSPSMSDEIMYPSPSYMQQPFSHYPLVGNGSHNVISATTNSGSPHTSVSGGTSVINSPLTPSSASVPSFVGISPTASRMSMKMDLDMACVDPNLRRPGSGSSASIPIEPVLSWIDHLGQVNPYHSTNNNSEHHHHHHPIQGTGTAADESGRNELTNQIDMIMEGTNSVFVKNGRGGHHHSSQQQQDQFHHGQSQSHNETQHYDLPMC